MRECVCPSVGAEEVLALDGCGDVAEDGLNVTFDGILPLLVWCGALVGTVAGFVESCGLVGAESGVVVAA